MGFGSKTYPLVSICIPTFNGEAYIAEALESALSQTYPNLEVIISDDASTDNTLSIISSFQEKSKIPIIIFKHQPHGIGANWNYCVSKAHSNYIKFLFQDDILLPSCVEDMMPMMVNYPKVGMVYCKREFLFETLTPSLTDFINIYGNVHTYWDTLDVKEGVVNGRQYLKDPQFLNAPKNKIGEPTNVLIRKACFDTIGFFNEDLQQTLDCDYWYRLMKRYDVGFVDQVLTRFRLHDQQASMINKTKSLPDQSLLYQSYYDHLFWQLHPKNQWKLLKRFHPLFKRLVSLKNNRHVNQ